jgi:putative glutamine amidotransferase
MKFLLSVLLSLRILFAFTPNDETVLLVIHPTAGNLKNIVTLIENELIAAENLKVVGIYNTNHPYNYTLSEKYLNDNNIDNITLKGFDFNLSAGDLFKNNDLSCQFYELFSTSDGIIFPGGADIPPSIYGEKTHLLTNLLEFERLFELSFLFHLTGGNQNETFIPFLNEKPDYVILGICLGMQNMNVAAGGTLWQDIPMEIYGHHTYENLLQANEERHKSYWQKISYSSKIPSFAIHTIQILPTSRLNFLDCVKTASVFNVLSIHHQSVKQTGKGFIVTGLSADGNIAELLEHTVYPNVIGIQFHPELWVIYDNEYTFRSNPNDTLKTVQDVLTDADMNFHTQFWRYFSFLLEK